MAISRLTLYEKIGPGTHPCHWCGTPVTWRLIKGPREGALLVDHLNWDQTDDSPDNLVPSCHVCNAHRTKKGDRRRINADELVVSTGSTQTRAIERHCLHCGTVFLAVPAAARKGKEIFCSRSCARKHQWLLKKRA